MKKLRIILLLMLCALILCSCTAKNNGGQDKQDTEPESQSDPDDNKPSEDPLDIAYSAYLDEIIAKRGEILSYNWQKGMVYDGEEYGFVPYGQTDSVAIIDIWGDELPELIYTCATVYDGYNSTTAELHIKTIDDGELVEIYSESGLDTVAGGGMIYRLFNTEGSKGLKTYKEFYSEGIDVEYKEFSTEPIDGSLGPVHVSSYRKYLDEKGENWIEEWYVDGEKSDNKTYDASIPSEEEQASGLIMRNFETFEYDNDIQPPESHTTEFPQKGKSMTYDEAVSMLREKLGIEIDMEVDEREFFESLPSFIFASGVGGWSTDLTVNIDGSFDGSYHDNEMGDTGDDYPNGTVFVCTFSGWFGEVKRLDEYTYSMRITDITQEKKENEEWIEDGTRYIASYPYGLENAEEILVFLPGSDVSTLPEEFVTWVAMPNAWGEYRPAVLPFYGLYNAAECEGFFGVKAG